MSSGEKKEQIHERRSGFQSAGPREAEILPEDVVETSPTSARVPLDEGLDWAALGTLFTLTLRQHLRGKRLVLLCFLFALPAVVAVVTRALNPGRVRIEGLEFAVVYMLLPHALIPLAALLYAAGLIQDEVEDQTLTYLLMRPLPRRALYVTKWLASWLLTAALAGVFGTITLVAVHGGESNFWGEIIPLRAVQLTLVLSLSLLAYCSLFGLIGVYTRRSLLIGIFYIFLFEGMLANIDFAIRKVTVMYYFRVLAKSWLDVRDRSNTWSLRLADAPDAGACVVVLLIVSLLLTLLAAARFSSSEFTVKTPGGN